MSVSPDVGDPLASAQQLPVLQPVDVGAGRGVHHANHLRLVVLLGVDERLLRLNPWSV